MWSCESFALRGCSATTQSFPSLLALSLKKSCYESYLVFLARLFLRSYTLLCTIIPRIDLLACHGPARAYL